MYNYKSNKINILIFGSKGFLARHFIKSFERIDFCRVFVIENVNSNLIDDADILINCAGSSNVAASFLDPIDDFRKNTSLVHQLLEGIRLSKNKNIRFINLSSAAVYGNPEILPIKENSVLKPISPYGFHKKMAEEICLEYNRCFGIKTLSLRIFSAYGPGQKKMLLWDLHNKILNSKSEISLSGTGNESRDFIHIEDIFQQLVLIIKHSNFLGNVVNIGNGVEVTIKDVANYYKMYHPVSFKYYFLGENRIGDPLNWRSDISIMRDWGYIQKVDIEFGIREYINWAINQPL